MTAAAWAGIVVLRATVAVVLVIHGVARVMLGGVAPFGEFLNAQGIPVGHAVAWTITLTEMLGGALLALGFLVRPLCAFFFVQIAAGIVLVHARAGWFVVGAGRNGMEFSVLLLAALVCVALTANGKAKADRR